MFRNAQESEQSNVPNLDSATSEALTANESSMGSSGGTTLVMMRMQSKSSFDFFRSLSNPGFIVSDYSAKSDS